MENRIKISSNGINTFATIKVNASKTGIPIISFLIIAEIILMIWLFSQATSEDLLKMFIPFLIIIFLFVGIPVKYLLWNLFGTEELIVNTKSISWSYDYGFFKTNLKTEKINRLGTGYERVKDSEN